MSRLDPDLMRVVERHRERHAAQAGARGPATAPPETVSLFAEFTGPIDDLVALGFQPHTVLRDPAAETTIATGRITVDALERLADVEHVKQLEASQPTSPQLDRSLPAAGIAPLHTAPYSLKGEGVVVGIIDTDIDIFHETFQTAAGTSRILALWNQKEVRPPGYNNTRATYGVEYLRSDINGFLAHPLSAQTIVDKNPKSALGATTENALINHGTKVAGIAVGSGGRPAGGGICARPQHEPVTGYIGVAPAADIVVVARAREDDEGADLTDAPGSVEIVDGLNYIFGQAGNRPAVVNISVGFKHGPRDGTSVFERAIDAMLHNGTLKKRAIVVASGNHAKATQHVSGKITAGTATDISMHVPVGVPEMGTTSEKIKNERLQLWYDAPDEDTPVTATLLSPPTRFSPEESVLIGPLAAGDDATTTVFDTEVRMQVVRYPGKFCIDIGWQQRGDEWDPWLPEAWLLRLASASGREILFDGWFEKVWGVFAPGVGDPSRTLVVPATVESVITVGSYDHQSGVIAPRSSYGATRDGRPKPDVVAPGVGVVSARGRSAKERLSGGTAIYRCCGCCCSDYEVSASEYETVTSGTSFAAPHVAGLIALMFQVKDDLTAAEIKDILRDTAVPPDGVTRSPTDPPYGQWGWGRINGVAAIDRVRQLLRPGGSGGTGGTAGRGVTNVSSGDEGGTSGSATKPAAGPATGDHGILSSAFGAMDRQRLDDPVGAHWAALVSRHFSEVRGLIFHQRRVALYWQRLGGPALVRGLIHEFGRHPAWARPSAPDAARFASYLDRFLDELDRLGSAGLRRDVRRHRPLLRTATPETLLSVLAAGTPATDTAA